MNKARRLKLILGGIVVLLLALSVAILWNEVATAKVRDDVATTPAWTARRLEIDQCVLWLMVPQEVSTTDFQCVAILENQSQSSAICGFGAYFIDCEMTLVSKDGLPIHYTKIGKGAISRDRDRIQYAHATLRPADVHSWKVNLADAFDSLRDGTYQLSFDTRIKLLSTGSDAPPRVTNFSVKDIPIKVLSARVDAHP